MRITQQMITRNYLTRMNNNLGLLNGSNNRLSAQRKFEKSWENVADAGKALKVRKLVVDNERYLTTIRDAEGRSGAAEDALRNANSLLTRIEDRVIEGLNGTMSVDDRDKIATEIAKIQDEVFQIMNTTYSDKFVFSAAGGANREAPFSKDAAGNLLYHGTYVDEMYKGANGKPMYNTVDANGLPISANIPYNKDNYVDIGAGYKVDDGKVDPNTAFKDTYSGVECFGYGMSDDGVPQNLYSLLGNMVNNLRSNDMDGLGKSLDAIGATMNTMLTSITEIGARNTTLEDAANRIEEELVNLYEIQNDLEGIDLSEEIMHNKQFEMGWMVTLQMGSKVLPTSIFDFLR